MIEPKLEWIIDKFGNYKLVKVYAEVASLEIEQSHSNGYETEFRARVFKDIQQRFPNEEIPEL